MKTWSPSTVSASLTRTGPALTALLVFTALALGACATTQSNVLPEYEGRSLTGGTLVLAPIQGDPEVEGLDAREVEGDPADAYAEFLRRELPALLEARTAFDRVVYAEYDGRPDFVSNVVNYQSQMRRDQQTQIDAPAAGRRAQFEYVEADYVLFLGNVKLLRGERAGMTTPDGMRIPSSSDIRQRSAFILWDNHAGRHVMNGGGTSDALANPVVNERTMQLAAEDLAAAIMDGSPFER